MKYNTLNLRKQTRPTRKGRGISAGEGKTAGRGTKGQGARKSGGVRPGFEGGQMPIYMRIPKLPGFKSKKPKTFEVKTNRLNNLKTSKVDNFTLFEEGLIDTPYTKVKVIYDEKITKKISIETQAISSGALKSVKAAGGKFYKTDTPKKRAKKGK